MTSSEISLAIETPIETASQTAAIPQSTTTYLIFSLDESLYAVDALAVREILWLPEVTPLQEMPPHMIGVINLRGRVLPVMDLNRRLGHVPPPYRLSDGIVVVEHAEKLVGIIVNAVCTVRKIAPHEVEPVPGYDQSIQIINDAARCLAGVAKVDADLVMLLQLGHVLQMDAGPALDQNGIASAAPGELRFDTDPEVRAIFQERARQLMTAGENRDFAGQIPLAIVGLNGE